ncbi:MAG: LON peptidase substrate-binding domain-containing protein [Planctomycetota bacterium]
MGNLDDLIRLPEDFDFRVRLFPLPSLVLFPHAMQPLHIFEPRYCEMLAEALETDELIAMATIDGEPSEFGSEPSIDSTICIGKIVSHVALEGERHNILLVGIRRARIVTELDIARSFRLAEVEVIEDAYLPSGNQSRSELRESLLHEFGNVIPATSTAKLGLSELLAGSIELGPITDIISHTLPLPTEVKLILLSEPSVDRRAERLIEFLKSGLVQLSGQGEDADSDEQNPSDGESGNRPSFPPPFSVN